MDIKKQLHELGLHPSKKSGQCFLLDQKILERIAAAGRLKKDDTVLEIGSGPGNLTRLLAPAAGRVVTIENDRSMIPLLHKNVGPANNVQFIRDDVIRWRKQQPSALSHRGYLIVANIPYYLTSLIIREFLSQKPQPVRLVLLVQAEVADRIVAQPGEHSLLSLSVQFYGAVEKLFMVPRTSFWPPPEVDSAVVRITVKREPQSSDRDFFRFLRVGFSARRKQLHNNLSAGFHLTRERLTELFDKCKVPQNARAQELSLAQWGALYELSKNSLMANIGKSH
ncbi:MAG: 16S rRNA (adenine(1518)-N(6)/adenine(1519)-N(6))-dimethyltransferase RsmA [Patescibacteria group bacterium]